MCTVTVVPHATGVRVMSNRDEQRTRPRALLGIHTVEGQLAGFPLDPVGGGTWVGVNITGTVVALLNRNADPGTRVRPPSQSRGLIARQLLACASAQQAMTAAAALDPRLFAPFTVVVVKQSTVGVAISNGASAVECDVRALHSPLLFTSSALGDAAVAGPRRQLFERLVLSSSSSWLRGQARFHRHRWRRRPEISVRMERDDARTVSQTTVDVASHRTSLLYEELPPDAARRERRQWCLLR
jgi:hypothetical protein